MSEFESSISNILDAYRDGVRDIPRTVGNLESVFKALSPADRDLFIESLWKLYFACPYAAATPEGSNFNVLCVIVQAIAKLGKADELAPRMFAHVQCQSLDQMDAWAKQICPHFAYSLFQYRDRFTAEGLSLISGFRATLGILMSDGRQFPASMIEAADNLKKSVEVIRFERFEKTLRPPAATPLQTDQDVDRAEFEVALSFAGEQRDYVHQTAGELRRRGVNCFYDEHEGVNTWGKDLYAYLDEIYRQKSKYTVIFISAEYARKLWTNHERKSAQARAFAENREYILPARFDDTELPGLLPTTGFVDLRKISPIELAELIERKVKGTQQE
jgi:TIR domain